MIFLAANFPQLVEIANQFRDQGVVGIDVAGNEMDDNGVEIPIEEKIVEGYEVSHSDIPDKIFFEKRSLLLSWLASSKV